MKDAEKTDAIEQYDRRQNLESVGVPIKNDQNTDRLVIEEAKLLQVEVAPKHILLFVVKA